MAHGGGEDWNAAVEEAVVGLKEHWPTAVAFGMANRASLQAATDSLVARGVDRIAVVRLFLSGSSFLEQTNYLLGLSPSPPTAFLHHPAHMGSTHTNEIPPPVSANVAFKTHLDGLAKHEGLGRVLVDRARELSPNRGKQSVLILAHGVGDPSENEKLLAQMAQHAQALEAAGFDRVRIETLREDWPEERAAAERRIREFVRDESGMGRDVLVLPFRVYGFGPYAEVLGELPHRQGRGLLPHPITSEWLTQVARELICEPGHERQAC